jgi:hypothetical protein
MAKCKTFKPEPVISEEWHDLGHEQSGVLPEIIEGQIRSQSVTAA